MSVDAGPSSKYGYICYSLVASKIVLSKKRKYIERDRRKDSDTLVFFDRKHFKETMRTRTKMDQYQYLSACTLTIFVFTFASLLVYYFHNEGV